METQQIQSEDIEIVSVNALIPHPKNMHEHSDEQIERLCKLIEYQGFRNPIICQRGTNLIVAGHGRLMAAKKLGMDKIPVSYQKFEDEAQLYAFMVSDNAIGKDTWASLDLSQINKDIIDLGPDLDLDMLGLKDFVVEPLDKLDLGEADSVPDVEKSISVKGDVWLMGNHRLICGDSTFIDDVQKVMNGQLADQMVTDPPYNLAYEGKTKEALTIQNDEMGDDQFREFLRDAFTAADTVMKPGAVFYIWHADSEGYNFRGACNDSGWKVRQCLIWKKQTMVMGGQDYHWKHEPCLYGWKDGAGHLWASDRKQTTILEFDRPIRNDVHPTMKPVNLIEYQIENNTKGGDIVLDLFLGSGTTLMAAEKCGRTCYGVELDPHYCDVIVNRWQEFTGKAATLEATGQSYSELRGARDGQA